MILNDGDKLNRQKDYVHNGGHMWTINKMNKVMTGKEKYREGGLEMVVGGMFRF